MVTKVTDTDFTFYQFTAEFCQKQDIEKSDGIDFDAFIASIKVSEDKKSMETTFAEHKVPGIVMTKQDSLPKQCTDNLLTVKGESGYTFDPQTDFKIFWQTFNEQYAFFGLENTDWNQIVQVASNAITSNTTEQELFDIFSLMITPLRDFHVEITHSDLDLEYTSPSRTPELESIALIDFLAINQFELPLTDQQSSQFSDYYTLQLEKTFLVIENEFADGEVPKFNKTSTIFWVKIKNNIGYLYVESMESGELGDSEIIKNNMQQLANTLDQVLVDFVGVQGLIIDVRFNGGGDDFVSQYIASRLTNQSYNAYSKQARLGSTRTPLQNIVIEPKGNQQYSGSIALLTSMSTASAAETFALAMRERHNTILIGEVSAGGFSDKLAKTLPSGMEFSLSNEIYVSVNGEEFEGLGVPVGIEKAFFTMEQRDAGEDLGLQAAIEWLL
jgi:hypothetical protein